MPRESVDRKAVGGEAREKLLSCVYAFAAAAILLVAVPWAVGQGWKSSVNTCKYIVQMNASILPWVFALSLIAWVVDLVTGWWKLNPPHLRLSMWRIVEFSAVFLLPFKFVGSFFPRPAGDRVLGILPIQIEVGLDSYYLFTETGNADHYHYLFVALGVLLFAWLVYAVMEHARAWRGADRFVEYVLRPDGSIVVIRGDFAGRDRERSRKVVFEVLVNGQLVFVNAKRVLRIYRECLRRCDIPLRRAPALIISKEDSQSFTGHRVIFSPRYGPVIVLSDQIETAVNNVFRFKRERLDESNPLLPDPTPAALRDCLVEAVRDSLSIILHHEIKHVQLGVVLWIIPAVVCSTISKALLPLPYISLVITRAVKRLEKSEENACDSEARVRLGCSVDMVKAALQGALADRLNAIRRAVSATRPAGNMGREAVEIDTRVSQLRRSFSGIPAYRDSVILSVVVCSMLLMGFGIEAFKGFSPLEFALEASRDPHFSEGNAGDTGGSGIAGLDLQSSALSLAGGQELDLGNDFGGTPELISSRTSLDPLDVRPDRSRGMGRGRRPGEGGRRSGGEGGDEDGYFEASPRESTSTNDTGPRSSFGPRPVALADMGLSLAQIRADLEQSATADVKLIVLQVNSSDPGGSKALKAYEQQFVNNRYNKAYIAKLQQANAWNRVDQAFNALAAQQQAGLDQVSQADSYHHQQLMIAQKHAADAAFFQHKGHHYLMRHGMGATHH